MSPDQKILLNSFYSESFQSTMSKSQPNNRPPGGLLLVQEAPQLLLKKVLLTLAHIWTKFQRIRACFDIFHDIHCLYGQKY